MQNNQLNGTFNYSKNWKIKAICPYYSLKVIWVSNLGENIV